MAWKDQLTDYTDLEADLDRAQRFYRQIGDLKEGLVQGVQEARKLLDARQQLADELDSAIVEKQEALSALELAVEQAGKDHDAQVAEMARFLQEKQQAQAEALKTMETAYQARQRELATVEGEQQARLQELRALYKQTDQQEGEVHAKRMGEYQRMEAELKERISKAEDILKSLTALRTG